MTKLVAIIYPDEFRAAEVLAALRRLQSEDLFDLDDASMMGLIFLNPLRGLAGGAIAGAIVGKLSDYGINDSFIRQLSEKMERGSSAIFMLVRHATLDKVEPEISKFGGHILHTNLPAEVAARYEALRAQAPQQASATPSKVSAPDLLVAKPA